MADLGLALCCRAIQIGFDRLTADELAEVVRYEKQRLAEQLDSTGRDATLQAQLHGGLGTLAGAYRDRKGR